MEAHAVAAAIDAITSALGTRAMLAAFADAVLTRKSARAAFTTGNDSCPGYVARPAFSRGNARRTRLERLAAITKITSVLIVAGRAVTQPKFKAHERGLMVLFASLVRHWRCAVRLIQPETVLRWHRHGFRLFWRRK
jgi:putative transposase